MSTTDKPSEDPTPGEAVTSAPDATPIGPVEPVEPVAAGPSRRRFLSALGAVTASSALLQSMTGAAPVEAAPLRRRNTPRKVRNGETVLVLGAGVGGLSAAAQLLDEGYDVKVLEALGRPGGRNFTARNGTKVVEVLKGGGSTEQECTFDKGLYLNLGPGRIPYHHRRVIEFCTRTGVALEPYIMESTANRWAGGFDSVAQTNRGVANDTRGHVAALLHQAIRKGKLANELSLLDAGQQKRLLELLVKFGDLDRGHNYAYTGSTRSGYRKPLAVDIFPEPPPPAPLAELIDAGFWDHQFYNPVDFLWQGTMFQPVGGMDKIVDALVAELPDGVITYNAPVTAIDILDDRVRVTWKEVGQTASAEVQHVVSNIPVPVLAGIRKTGFSSNYLKAIGFVQFDPSCKVGWQADKRFWENDEYQIYGGISWTNDIINQVWYPSNDYFTGKGTMTGAYNFDADAIKLGDMAPPDRLEVARESAARLHPEFADKTVVLPNGLSIAWHQVPYQAGVSVHWNPADPDAAVAYSTMLSPDQGLFYVVGDQVSPLPGWQEGALMSAEYVVDLMTDPERREPPVVHRVPDSRAMRP
ncbi:flavin monoamine oxidase family protein [Saccharothrix sp. NRRL B-16314]|uniref:flavin monoamine oxidase family protein n=1 Tax=Saccharothrix sp. NRRL B-16314 TaxID=1463825 RepID=UPI000B026DA8|nr:FAD-dependent oxidoreductase [Saccharothrix sp. NRRL B-16314]